MNGIIKSIWVNKITIGVTLIQVLVPIIFGTKFWSISLIISICINVLAMILINYSIVWFVKRGQNENAENYRKYAPCTFQAIKFMLGIIASSILAVVSLYKNIEWINVGQIVVSWYFVPFALVFVTIALFDSGYYETKKISEKPQKIFGGLKNLLSIMYDKDKDGRIIFTLRGMVSSVALFCIFVLIGFYFLSKFV